MLWFHRSTVFSDELGGGIIIKTANGISLAADFQPSNTVGNGGVAMAALFSGNSLTVGTAELSASSRVATPEPGTLGLLGTGLFSLAGIARRKLRLSRPVQPI